MIKLKEYNDLEKKVGAFLQTKKIKYSTMRANASGHPVVNFYDKRDMDIAQKLLEKAGFKVYDKDVQGLRIRRMTVKEELSIYKKLIEVLL